MAQDDPRDEHKKRLTVLVKDLERILGWDDQVLARSAGLEPRTVTAACSGSHKRAPFPKTLRALETCVNQYTSGRTRRRLLGELTAVRFGFGIHVNAETATASKVAEGVPARENWGQVRGLVTARGMSRALESDGNFALGWLRMDVPTLRIATYNGEAASVASYCRSTISEIQSTFHISSSRPPRNPVTESLALLYKELTLALCEAQDPSGYASTHAAASLARQFGAPLHLNAGSDLVLGTLSRIVAEHRERAPRVFRSLSGFDTSDLLEHAENTLDLTDRGWSYSERLKLASSHEEWSTVEHYYSLGKKNAEVMASHAEYRTDKRVALVRFFIEEAYVRAQCRRQSPGFSLSQAKQSIAEARRFAAVETNRYQVDLTEIEAFLRAGRRMDAMELFALLPPPSSPYQASKRDRLEQRMAG